MKKCKFGDGGEIREGRNENIADDTRERAMAWLKRQQEGGAEEAPAEEAPAAKEVARPERMAGRPAPKAEAKSAAVKEAQKVAPKIARAVAAAKSEEKRPTFSMNREAAPAGLRKSATDILESYMPNVSAGMRNMNKGIMGYKKGGSVSSASRRADGIAKKGKTKGRML